MVTWQDFAAEIRRSEGVVSHLYLDTVGKVTVGVGNLLPTVADAQRLAFVGRGTLRPATAAEIAADYAAVQRQPRGLRASAYLAHTSLDLPHAAIDTLLQTRIEAFRRELGTKFPKFAEYPLTVQFALLDMAFNLGTHGLVSKFPSFTRAVLAGDWATAARESHRPQVQATRNAVVRGWLQPTSSGTTP